jgi:hypothetical protein
MAEWHGPLIPREVLDHRGRWVAIDSNAQPPRILLVRDTREEVVAWQRATGTRAVVMRVPTEDEPELVGSG